MNLSICHRLLFIAALMLTCCCCKTQQASTEVNHDQKMEIRYEYIKTHDTIQVAIPYESVKNVTKDTNSILETSVAISYASIDSFGLLHHILTNRYNTGLKATVENIVQVRDSIVYINNDKVITKYVTHEKDLNGWQKFQIYGFWVCLLVIVILLIWIFRKPLLKIIRLCIGII